ncbi:hypothetical protein TNCV_2622221 [Trichonephila clavipes]|uniref:Uncharacterized protein n=1 Tax=Trichonephila clavipes TaxID=2585209 RepID=A0A8X7BI35_TRICX|nr:hypothetical protein TNCV_2622221 [Trichonephila clavipes]
MIDGKKIVAERLAHSSSPNSHSKLSSMNDLEVLKTWQILAENVKLGIYLACPPGSNGLKAFRTYRLDIKELSMRKAGRLLVDACKRCYRITIHRPAVSTFHDPGFFRHRPFFSPVPTFFSPVVARSFSLSRLSFDLLPGAGSCSLHAPPKSKICPLWLILPYQTPGTENSQTVTQKIHKQNTQQLQQSKVLMIVLVKVPLKQTHEIISIVHPIEISDYVPRKI